MEDDVFGIVFGVNILTGVCEAFNASQFTAVRVAKTFQEEILHLDEFLGFELLELHRV